MSSKVFIIVCLCFIVIGQFATSAPAKKKKLKAKKVTLAFVWKKVQMLESKLKQAEMDLDSTRTRVQQLASQPMKLGTDTLLFQDERKCPIKLPGFYHSAMFQSCYHLEPSNVLLNWTESVNLCKSYNPKAHLVSIESEAEMDYLKAKWFAERGIASVSRFWTSGHRDGLAWRWMGTDEDFTYQNWIPTTTHEDDRFQCLAVYSNEGYYWGDVACWGPHMVTCEMNL